MVLFSRLFGKNEDEEAALLRWVNSTEAESRTGGLGVAPAPFEMLSVRCRNHSMSTSDTLAFFTHILKWARNQAFAVGRSGNVSMANPDDDEEEFVECTCDRNYHAGCFDWNCDPEAKEVNPWILVCIQLARLAVGC
jgi:hypothetical protein